MAMNLLSLQSHVAYGHVGHSAAVFALQRIGVAVWPVHTVQLSNHTRYETVRGQAFDAEVLRIFRLYSWPGNVRELRNVVENMILLGNSDHLGIDDVPIEVRKQVNQVGLSHVLSPHGAATLSFEQEGSSTAPNLKLSERAAIEAALAEARGNLTDAAKRLVNPIGQLAVAVRCIRPQGST